MADQVDRNMRDAGQIPLPDEDAELSDMSYDNENYTYYGNKEIRVKIFSNTYIYNGKIGRKIGGILGTAGGTYAGGP